MNDQNAYEAEVRRIAEILADIEHPILFKVLRDTKILPCEDITAQKVIEEKLSQARAMVAEMAKAFREGYDYSETEPIWQPSKIDSYMIVRGLIPSPENEQK